MPSTNLVTLSSLVASRRPTFICSSLKAVSTPGRAASDQYRTASVPYWSNRCGRRDDVALRLRHLLAVGVEDPAVDRRVGPRQRAVLVVGPHDGREQPGADDLGALRTEVHREHLRPQVSVVDPAAGDLRRERRRRPRVHDVRVADEAAGLAALVVGVAGRRLGRRIDRQRRLGRDDRVVVVDLAVRAERVPQRDRHAEEALAADQPVAVEALDPVVVAVAHVVGEPVQLLAPRQEAPRGGPARGRRCGCTTGGW